MFEGFPPLLCATFSPREAPCPFCFTKKHLEQADVLKQVPTVEVSHFLGGGGFKYLTVLGSTAGLVRLDKSVDKSVLSHILYFHTYLRTWSNLTNVPQMGFVCSKCIHHGRFWLTYCCFYFFLGGDAPKRHGKIRWKLKFGRFGDLFWSSEDSTTSVERNIIFKRSTWKSNRRNLRERWSFKLSFLFPMSWKPDFQNGLHKQTFKNIWHKEVFGRVWIYGDLV